MVQPKVLGCVVRRRGRRVLFIVLGLLCILDLLLDPSLFQLVTHFLSVGSFNLVFKVVLKELLSSLSVELNAREGNS